MIMNKINLNEFTSKQKDVIKNKNKQYSDAGEVYNYFNAYKKVGNIEWYNGAVSRLVDKLSRFHTIVDSNFEINEGDEPLLDTVGDFINYCCLIYSMLDQTRPFYDLIDEFYNEFVYAYQKIGGYDLENYNIDTVINDMLIRIKDVRKKIQNDQKKDAMMNITHIAMALLKSYEYYMEDDSDFNETSSDKFEVMVPEITARNVSEILLRLTRPEIGEIVSKIWLQYMLYLIQGYSWSTLGKPMFKDDIKINDNNLDITLKIEDVHEWCRHTDNGVEYSGCSAAMYPLNSLDEKHTKPFDEDQYQLIIKVYNMYKDYSVVKLHEMLETHLPILNARRYQNSVISWDDTIMEKFFNLLAELYNIDGESY